MESHHSRSKPSTSDGLGQKSPDDLVMGTNSSSIVSKRSVERLYYPHEPHFFRYFVPKFQRRAPLINRGYWLRLKAIDTVVHDFLSQESPRKKVVVNLGCGRSVQPPGGDKMVVTFVSQAANLRAPDSDVLPWQCNSRWPELSQNTLFVDVDFRDLLEGKRRVILATPELQQLLEPFEIGDDSSSLLLKSRRYCQVGCDLRDLPLLKHVLAGLVGGSVSDASFLFVAEVSITYLETQKTDDIIHWASTLGDSSFCLLEQIIPDGPENPFARTMLAHFDKLKTPLRSVYQYPDLGSQNRRFLSRGWQNVRSWTLWEAWADSFFISPEERIKLDQYEPFDEWEEFALFASHYLVLWASTTKPPTTDNAGVETPWPSADPSVVGKCSLEEPTSRRGQRRFGAAMVVQDALGQEYISHVMGHGERSRLSSVNIYTTSPGPLELPAHVGGPTARVCHTLTNLGPHGVLLIGGRTSPSNALADCWLFRQAIGSWERVQDLPVPLFRQAVLRLGQSSLALVVGGKIGHRKVSARSYVYHPLNGWLTCHVDGVHPAAFGATLCLTSIDSPSSFQGLLLGGMSPDGTHRRDVFHWAVKVSSTEARIVFRLCDDTQEVGAGVTRMLSRFGATCLSHGRNVVLIGGVTAGHQLPQSLDILVLQASARGLRIVGSIGADHDLVPGRPFLVGSSAVAHADGSITIVGGGGTCFSMGTCWSAGTFKVSVDADGILAGTDSLETLPLALAQTCEIVPTGQSSSTPNSGVSNPTSIPRVRLESNNQFAEVLSATLPTIISGVDVGSCVEKWTPEYLVNRVGADRKVSVHEASSSKMDFNTKNFSYIVPRFEDFIAQAQSGGKVYLRSLSAAAPSATAANLAHDFPTLAEDFCLPPEFDVVEQNMHSSVLRISGAVDMWLHYDVMANIYVQVRGSRRLILFHPRSVTRLGFEAGASSSSIDVFKALEDGSIKSVQAFEAILEPGDVLFLPPMWLHAARAVSGFSVAVNVFFRNLQTGYALGRDVYGNRDLTAYEKGRTEVEKIVSTFDRVPRDASEFYLRRLAEELLLSGTGSI